jgi:hypothetical protein
MLEDVAPQYHAQIADDGFIDTSDQRACSGFWHCITCGTYVDRVYLANKRKQAQEQQVAELVVAA